MYLALAIREPSPTIHSNRGNVSAVPLSSIQLTASNTSYLKEGDKGINRLVPVNDGINNDMDEVGVSEQGSTSRQFHPCSGEAFSS